MTRSYAHLERAKGGRVVVHFTRGNSKRAERLYSSRVFESREDAHAALRKERYYRLSVPMLELDEDAEETWVCPVRRSSRGHAGDELHPDNLPLPRRDR